MAEDICPHLEKLDPDDREPVHPSDKGCKECLEAGNREIPQAPRVIAQGLIVRLGRRGAG